MDLNGWRDALRDVMPPVQDIFRQLHRCPELSGYETQTRQLVREMLERLELKHERILGVHQPFMERRICAAMGVYWPDQSFRVTSPQVTIPEYLREAERQGMTREGSISVIVGDFQRMDLYARLGYQLPQEIPEQAWEAFRQLVDMGYDKQLAK